MIMLVLRNANARLYYYLLAINSALLLYSLNFKQVRRKGVHRVHLHPKFFGKEEHKKSLPIFSWHDLYTIVLRLFWQLATLFTTLVIFLKNYGGHLYWAIFPKKSWGPKALAVYCGIQPACSAFFSFNVLNQYFSPLEISCSDFRKYS